MGALKKDETNPFHSFNYVSIDTYYEVVALAARNAGLTWRIYDIGAELIVREFQTDKPIVGFHVAYGFELIHEKGEIWPDYDRVNIWHPIQGAQTAGSARSYAEKIFMRSLFKIVTGEKDADETKQVLEAHPQAPMPGALAGSTPPPAPAPIVAPAPAPPAPPAAPPEAMSPAQQQVMSEIPEPARPPEPDRQTMPDGTVIDAGTGEVIDQTSAPPEPEGPTVPPELAEALPRSIQMPADAPFTDAELKVVAPSMHMGLPVMTEPAKGAPHNWPLVAEVFRVFAVLVPNEDALKAWWNQNTAALGALAEGDDALYEQVKGFFTTRRQELVPPQ